LALNPGTRLGPFEITTLLGVGGMGEVYRATDTNLKRHVAIKVLPASVAADPERLARFQREAEILAALNHPNIAHIHGLEKADGTVALMMELVEGATLSDRIAEGAIPKNTRTELQPTEPGGRYEDSHIATASKLDDMLHEVHRTDCHVHVRARVRHIADGT
jgi:serine/threonine protein kinase